VYTFGAPPGGQPAFGTTFNTTLTLFRVCSSADPVPDTFAYRLLGYQQSGTKVLLTPNKVVLSPPESGASGIQTVEAAAVASASAFLPAGQVPAGYPAPDPRVNPPMGLYFRKHLPGQYEQLLAAKLALE